MANLMARNGHLVADGGHLVAATTDCVQKCCGCLACTISGRVGTVTISGLTSVTGNVAVSTNDLCDECPALNGSYGGDFGTVFDAPENTFMCGSSAPNAGTECEGYLIEILQTSLYVLYNASGSTLTYYPTGALPAYSVAIPPDYTYIFAILEAVAQTVGVSYCSSIALFSVLQSGRVACPFSDLALPLAASGGGAPGGGGCFCNIAGATVTAGIA